MSDALGVGDNFVVIAPQDNEEVVDFYVLKCTTEKTQTKTLLRDAWGNVCNAGSYVIKGVWYQQARGNPYEFKLLRSKPEVILQSHLVRAIKFPMQKVGRGRKFLLSLEVYEAIYNSTPFDV